MDNAALRHELELTIEQLEKANEACEAGANRINELSLKLEALTRQYHDDVGAQTLRGDAHLRASEELARRLQAAESRLDDALDKAGRFDKAEVWAQKLELENADLRSRLDAVSKVLTEWRDPEGSRMIHREFATAVLEKALKGNDNG
jgi:hypothetical protein